MGSSKMISNREIFYLVLLVQQSGLFWLLPYFLVRGNGTAGLIAVFPGVFAAICIVLVGHYWGTRITETGFVTALCQKHRAIGVVLSSVFCLFYLFFAVLMLYSFVDVVQKQLLPETPLLVLCAVTVFLAGWLSKGGLEGIVRFNMLCVGSLFVILMVSICGTLDLFTPETALPIRINSVSQLGDAAMHSVFCYSGLLSIFMLYPASDDKHSLYKALLGAVGAGALVLILWTAYTLCILGEYSLQAVLWIPIHLARMVQIGTLLDQTESLFIVLWMTLVMSTGSLYLWCILEGVHQLIKAQRTPYVYYGILLAVLSGMLALHNTMGLLQMERIAAKLIMVLLPIMLLFVIILTPKRRKPQ